MNVPSQSNSCNEQAFAVFFKKHAHNLHQFLHFRYGENLNPKDKAQEAFVKLWEHCKKVTPEKAKSFLYTTANNLMLNEVKHQKVVLKYNVAKPQEHNHESPQFILEEQEYMKRLQKALHNLTEAERVAFMMNKTEGKRYKEIAEILDISVSAVEKRIYSALIKLRKDIKEL